MDICCNGDIERNTKPAFDKFPQHLTVSHSWGKNR